MTSPVPPAALSDEELLIAKLRERASAAEITGASGYYDAMAMREAANALATLRAENEALKQSNDHFRQALNIYEEAEVKP